jgi:hypothetical protein
MTVWIRGHNQSTEHQLNVHIVQGESGDLWRILKERLFYGIGG